MRKKKWFNDVGYLDVRNRFRPSHLPRTDEVACRGLSDVEWISAVKNRFQVDDAVFPTIMHSQMRAGIRLEIEGEEGMALG